MDVSRGTPWAQIASMAMTARDRGELRSGLLRVATCSVGGDGGFIQRVLPDHDEPEHGTFHELDIALVRRCHEGRHTVYAAELGHLSRKVATDQVVVDTHVFDARLRARSAFYSDVMRRHGARETMMGSIVGAAGEVSAICLMHRARTASPFTRLAVQSFRTLLPVIELADRYFALRQQHADTDIMIDGLTKRERDIVRLLALGYTNGEIAFALGTSVFTVRNQLVGIYRKTGVTRRAELAGLVGTRSPPA